jgi:Domain of unknown function (DUF4424)
VPHQIKLTLRQMEGSALARSLLPSRLPVAWSASGASFAVPARSFFGSQNETDGGCPADLSKGGFAMAGGKGRHRPRSCRRRSAVLRATHAWATIVADACRAALADGVCRAAVPAGGGERYGGRTCYGRHRSYEKREHRMLSEHLHISSRQIHVRYRFYNTSPKEVTILVAFPMPDITVEDSTTNISVPTHSPQNLLRSSTFVNDKQSRRRSNRKYL